MPDEPIAVVGMGCRLPDADDPAALLDVVLTRRRAFRRLPPCRIDLLDYYSADPSTPDATYSTRAALLEGWRFDWRAFDIPELAYQAADPAHWLALETAARALAAAGFPGGSGLASHRTGVIIGNSLTGDASRAAAMRLRWPYVRRVLADSLARTDIPRDRAAQVLRHAATRYLAPFPGISGETLADSKPATISARICSFFGFRGGSLAVDGSSASSLLAVAAACTALAAGDLDVALAGGVDLSIDPLELVGLAKTGVLASGDVRVYDENPTGFLPGEGCGVVVLMRSSDARNAGVPIYAEIAGWGVSSGGQAGPAEADPASHLLALHRAYQRAGIDPADVQLIEGHGAGTLSGDVAELTALMQLRAGTRQRAALGSVKANIGHAKAAAGSAGLIKTILALSTGLIPPSTGFRTPHPLLRDSDSALWLPDAPSAWPDGVRIAGVSAMGTGGSNAHLVLRGWPDRGRHKARHMTGQPGGRAVAGDGSGASAGDGSRGMTGRARSWRTGPWRYSSARDGSARDGSARDGSARNRAGRDRADSGGTASVAAAEVGAELAARGWLPTGGTSRSAAYLLHAADRSAMHDLLARIAQIAPWLSDGEMSDLACQLARDARVQGPVRVAIVASRQEQLARLAKDGMTLLPRLGDGLLAVRPGVYAADKADGRVTLLLPGSPAEPDRGAGQDDDGDEATSRYRPGPADTVRIALSALSWLDRLGVRACAAVGHGQGELAGLAWAGCMAESDAIALAIQLAEIVATAQEQHSGPAERAARLRTAAARLKLFPPARRLIAASTGRELEAILDITEMLSAQLDPPAETDQALRAGAIGASLFLETGPGRALTDAVSAWSPVPAVSLAAGTGTGKDAARAIAALFAVGALANPGVLPAGQPARAIDIWRDQVFITNPCQSAGRPAIPAQARRELPAGSSCEPALAPASQAVAAPAVTAPAPAASSRPLSTGPDSTGPDSTGPAGSGPAGSGPAETGRGGTGPGSTRTGSRGPVSDGPEPAALLQAPPDARPFGPRPYVPIPPGPAAVPPGPSAPAAGSAAASPPATGSATPARPAAPHVAPCPAAGPRPAATTPASTTPVTTMPVSTTPASAAPDSAATDSAGTDSAATDSAATDSAGTDSAATDSAGTDSAATDSAGTDSAATDSAGTDPAGPARTAGSARTAGPARTAADGGDDTDDPVPGAAPWVRAFTERLDPVDWDPPEPGVAQRWRIRSSPSEALRPLVSQFFTDDSSAHRVLAIVPDPTDSACCVSALLAAQDAITYGQLVVITHGPGFTGFFASLHAEHPGLGITVLRVPEGPDGMRSAQRFAVTEPGRFFELVIDVAGRPHRTSMVPVQPAGQGNFPLGPADVVLVSRGTGGAGLAVAQVLACCGAAIAVIGRADPAGDSDVVASLEKMRAAGARVTSELADMGSKAEMTAAVGRIERKLGMVTAIVHAAEPGAPRPLGGLTETGLRANVAAQTAGLSQLLGAVKREQISLIVTFGSIVGRYGLARAGVLALASGSLACQAQRAAETISGCQALHVDWPTWTGPAPRRPAIAERLTRAGVRAIPVDEGSRLLLKMLSTPDFPASAAVHGRIGTLGPRVGTGYRSGRFIQAVRIHYPGVELVCEAQLTPGTDPYLADYQMDGIRALPPAMALEAMAQAATVLAGGPVRHAASVSAGSPVVVASGASASAVIRICAVRDGDTITVALRCADSGFTVDHLRAEFDCGPAGQDEPSALVSLPELDEMAASDAGIVDGTELYGPVCFQAGRFRRAALLPEVTSRSCRALVIGGDDQPWFAGQDDQPGGQLILGSPGLADATWHVLQACVPHRRLQLAGCDKVQFSGRAADGIIEVRAVRAARAQGQGSELAAGTGQAPQTAHAQREARDTARQPVIPRQAGSSPPGPRPAALAPQVWDVEAVDSAGRPLITWTGLRLRDAGPLPRTAKWPPALLAVYLEHSAVSLGLDPELRVALARIQPDEKAAVPRPAPPADDTAGPARKAVPGTVATGTGPLAGHELSVWAGQPVTCSWAAAKPDGTGETAAGPGETSHGDPDPDTEAGPAGPTESVRSAGPAGSAGPELGGLAADLRDRLGDPPAVLAARLTALADCVAAGKAPAMAEWADVSVTGEWVRLSVGGAELACAAVWLDGVKEQVAIALMTGPPVPPRRRQQPVAASRPSSAGREDGPVASRAAGQGGAAGRQAGPVARQASTPDRRGSQATSAGRLGGSQASQAGLSGRSRGQSREKSRGKGRVRPGKDSH